MRARRPQVNRRSFFSAVAAAPALSLIRPGAAAAELPKAKVTRVRIYKPPESEPTLQSEQHGGDGRDEHRHHRHRRGGAKDTLEQCAGTLIGQNPFRTEALWQEAYIAWFYPPGREKAHALGALDLALWDIKGKALGLPVHELLGGAARDYCECYATGGATPPAHRRRALESRGACARDDGGGISGVRMAPAEVPVGGVYDTRSVVRQVERNAGRSAKRSARPATGASTCISDSI